MILLRDVKKSGSKDLWRVLHQERSYLQLGHLIAAFTRRYLALRREQSPSSGLQQKSKRKATTKNSRRVEDSCARSRIECRQQCLTQHQNHLFSVGRGLFL
ncbi:hypothetical protein NPIL_70961 [Nephila pilipes]|uniref:Uncharacterized protein n=1 Tax=Nephila pilipes TaxID=299642 RepID=A0A8X6MUM5_NEPPI|nr:hypothetical protein NPIL_70961 [Nephila pilipes]